MTAVENAINDLEEYVRDMEQVVKIEQDKGMTEAATTDAHSRVYRVIVAPGVGVESFERVLRVELYNEFLERREYDVESFVFNTVVKGFDRLALVVVVS